MTGARTTKEKSMDCRTRENRDKRVKNMTAKTY